MLDLLVANRSSTGRRKEKIMNKFLDSVAKIIITSVLITPGLIFFHWFLTMFGLPWFIVLSVVMWAFWRLTSDF